MPVNDTIGSDGLNRRVPRSHEQFERRRKVIAALEECSRSGNLGRGKHVHEAACQSGDDSNICVASMLINMYAKCRSIQDAQNVFDSIKHPNVVCWNALILGYAANGEGAISLDFFSQMGRGTCAPDARSFVAAGKACIDLALKGENDKVHDTPSRRAKKLHLLALRCGCDSDAYVQGTFVDMYAKCGSMEEARKVFDRVTEPDVVTWTAIILGYAENGEGCTGLSLFSQMRLEGCALNARTFVACLKSSSYLEDDNEVSKRRGNASHLLAVALGFESNVYVQTTLVDVYAKCGNMKEARKFFEGLKHPNVVCWNALMFGYVVNGEANKALKCFICMKSKGLAPNLQSFLAAFKACSMLGSLDFGQTLHAEIRSCDLKHCLVLRNCIIDFYAKCGNLTEAQDVFDSFASKNIVTWNALIAGYGRQGETKLVFDIFNKMLDTGVRPNGVTLLTLLTACDHAGLVDKGKDYFQDFSRRYGINPHVEHCTCLMDMLGRANKLDEAMALQRSMHFSWDVVTWMAILGSCWTWKNVEVGRLSFESLVSLDKGNAGPYVVMANLYGWKGMFSHQAMMQEMSNSLRTS